MLHRVLCPITKVALFFQDICSNQRMKVSHPCVSTDSAALIGPGANSHAFHLSLSLSLFLSISRSINKVLGMYIISILQMFQTSFICIDNLYYYLHIFSGKHKCCLWTPATTNTPAGRVPAGALLLRSRASEACCTQ